MGFRFRKSVKLMPGVRLNLSKTGIGFSAGVPGLRYTRRADGKSQRTMSIPGTGISHVTINSDEPAASAPTSRKTAKCPKCGKRYRIATSNFCSNCGMQLP